MAVDFKELESIIKLMEKANLAEIELKNGDQGIHLRRAGCDQPLMQTPVAPVAPVAAVPAVVLDDPKLLVIKSPIVGTFYSASSPEAAAFVQVGSKVAPDTVVCIIEAMKVLSEIHAEVSGTIVEVLVQNGHAVEFGQPLFKVKP